jgi:hypothetical protein
MSTIVTKVHGYGNEKCPGQKKRTKGNTTRRRQRAQTTKEKHTREHKTTVTKDKAKEKQGRDTMGAPLQQQVSVIAYAQVP